MRAGSEYSFDWATMEIERAVSGGDQGLPVNPKAKEEYSVIRLKKKKAAQHKSYQQNDPRT
jgi:hypothetical protein